MAKKPTPKPNKPTRRAPEADRASGAIADVQAQLAELSGRLLNLEGRAIALLRRQIVNLDRGLAAVRNPLGWLILPREEFPFLLHFSDGVSAHEPGTVALLQKLLRPGDVAIDAGAHIGLLSLPMARMVQPNGRVIAIEPNPRSLECLRRTLEVNLLSHLADLVEAAASDADGSTEFHLGVNSMMGSLVLTDDPTRNATVQTVRLDSIIPSGSTVDLVKIDVEGAELQVINGMRRIIDDNPEIVLIAEYGPAHLKRIGVTAQAWVGALHEVGFDRIWAVNEESGTCSPIDVDGLDQLTETVNLLCSRAANPRIRAVCEEEKNDG